MIVDVPGLSSVNLNLNVLVGTIMVGVVMVEVDNIW